jgi:AcrR family transcriptional regulator
MGRLYAGQSAQDRADARRRRFLDAAIELIGTRGLADTTVRAICEQAGLSTRFFYESFDGLEAIALAAYDDVVAAALATLYPAVVAAGPDREGQARTAVRLLVDFTRDEPQRARMILVESLSGPLAARRRDTMKLLAAVTATLGRDLYALPEDDPLVPVSAAIVSGGVTELLIGLLDGSIDAPREQVIERAARLFLAIGEATG